MIPSQMLKGLLEGAILEVIGQQETYAYEISQLLKDYGFGDISEGTIYPMILRLQKNNYIVGKSQDSPSGPKRKYYRLSQEGEDYLRQFKEDWTSLKQALTNLLDGEQHE